MGYISHTELTTRLTTIQILVGIVSIPIPLWRKSPICKHKKQFIALNTVNTMKEKNSALPSGLGKTEHELAKRVIKVILSENREA